MSAVKAALETAGIPASSYAWHSFWIWAVTLVGIPDSLIQMLGQWVSSAYLSYIQTPRDSVCAEARTLVRFTSPD